MIHDSLFFDMGDFGKNRIPGKTFGYFGIIRFRFCQNITFASNPRDFAYFVAISLIFRPPGNATDAGRSPKNIRSFRALTRKNSLAAGFGEKREKGRETSKHKGFRDILLSSPRLF
jgi:hypothetical protein